MLTNAILQYTTVDELGSSLVVAAVAGDAQLTVDWTVDFGEEGTLVLAGVQYDYDQVDADTGIITLAAGTQITAAAAVGEPVTLLTAVADESAVWQAYVLLPDGDQPQPAVVPIDFRRYFKTDDSQAGSVVPVEQDATGALTVKGPPGSAASETDLEVPAEGVVNFFGQWILGDGVTAPANSPRPSSDWSHPAAFTVRTIGGSNSDPGFGVQRGIWDDGTSWLYALSVFGGQVFAINKTTGVETLVLTLPSGYNPVGGVVKIGTDFYVLGFDSNRSSNWYVYKYNSSGVKQLEWRYIAPGTGAKFPALTVNGTNLMIVVWTTAAGPVDRIVATTFAPGGDGSGNQSQVGSNINCDLTGTKQDLVGAYFGNADFGSSTLVVLAAAACRAFSVAGTTGTRNASLEWGNTAGSFPDTYHGLAWDGTRFHILGATQPVVWHLSQNATARGRSISSTLVDSNVTGGTHETNASPAVVWVQRQREWIKVDVDPPLDAGGSNDPDSAGIYIDNHLQEILGPGDTSGVYDIPTTGGVAPPNVNGFAGVAAPGEFLTAAADALGHIIELFGSGDGLVGPLGWAADRGPDATITGASVITMAAGWTLTAATVERYGTWIQGLITFTRATGAATINVVDGTADLTNTAVGTLADGLRPRITLGGQSAGAGRNATYDVGTGGVVSLAALAGANDIAAGDAFSMTLGYFAKPAA